MILSLQCSGQMCNRIVWFVRALATAIDLKTDIVHPFGREIRSFSDLHPEEIPEIGIRCFGWGRSVAVDVLHGWLARLPGLREKEYAAGNPDRVRRWRENGRKNLLLWNWHFDNREAVVRHRRKIVGYLRAKDSHCRRPDDLVGDMRKDGAAVVGVHIRRGDYREAAPRWCYGDGDYLRMMKEFGKSHAGGCRFAIVSNEPVDIAFFRRGGVDAVDASGTPQEDVVTLSLCDFIMGPPSTFSWWAAYYGGRPRMPITGRDATVSEDRFSYVAAPVPAAGS